MSARESPSGGSTACVIIPLELPWENEPMKQVDRADPCMMVIFGATGDLTRRKLIPALCNLELEGALPERFGVIGAARREVGTGPFRASLREGMEAHSRQSLLPEAWERFAERITYSRCRFDDPEGYVLLARHLQEREKELDTGGNRLYYLATPPSAFPVILEQMAAAGLNHPGQGGSWARVVVEKPIGSDLESARELNRIVNGVFPEKDVFRIDHYLGKETVQNLMVFRFANAIFEPLWNTKYVDHVQITVAESIGVEGRGAYYEEAGTTRDMVQNHMFQLLCLTAMEPPVSLDAGAIRDEKVKVLRALRPLSPEQVAENTVRAQYAEGVSGGRSVPGYLQEEGVSQESTTETYVAIKLYIDNWRWAQVPFYLRAGKRMPKRLTEISLQFRDVPHRLFGAGTGDLASDSLTLRIQPDEGITLKFDAKKPGSITRIKPVSMDFSYAASFEAKAPEAYERLILDAMLGDGTLFIRRDEVEGSWNWIDRLYEGWESLALNALPEYTAGTWGPGEADVLMARGGRTWRRS